MAVPSIASAATAARAPQPLWALVPVAARGRYLRRLAQALLDEADSLAAMLSRAPGLPRTDALLGELLPSVGGLHELADEGPETLEDRRLGRIPALRAGRRSVLISAPLGVVGVRAGAASPWAEPVLEVGAALLAGNGVVLSPATDEAGRRLIAACARSGVPDGLVQVVAPGAPAAELEAACDHVSSASPASKGTMLVLAGAPIERVVGGALWAAFARGGQGPAAVGRIIAVPQVADELLTALQEAARRLRVGDPLDAETEIGPLASPEDLERVDTLVREAVAAGAVQVAGGPVEDLGGPFYAPAVLRHVPRDARVLTGLVPGPVLSLVEARDEADAIALAQAASAEGDAAMSVWAGDRAHGERVARHIGAELSWVNEHGTTPPAAPVRLGRHSELRQIASQPTRLRSARWLPYDPALVEASQAAARLTHGRESERGEALRAGAIPLARVAVRLAREALRR